jgi:hypothetical protein
MAPATQATAAAEPKTLSPDETGLAKTKTPGVITTATQYQEALARWQDKYNVLTPFTSISGIAPSFGLIASIVKVRSDKADGEVYDGLPFLKANEVALAKVGLRKLAECGGISTSTVRTDPRTIKHYWEFKAVATYRGLDGSNTTREATFEWDLRDGSDRLKGWTANQITEGRKNGLRNCEARAINAAIRESGCGIKQKYTRAELEKPFLVIRVAFQPDMADPAIKALVTQQALSGSNALYPPTAREVPDAQDAEFIEDAPRHVGRGSTAPPAATAAAAKADEPPTADAVKIASAVIKEGVNATTKRPWKRTVVIDSNGVEYSSFDTGHYDDAIRFKTENAWVEIASEKNGSYNNIIEIVKAGTEPPLPGLDEV